MILMLADDSGGKIDSGVLKDSEIIGKIFNIGFRLCDWGEGGVRRPSCYNHHTLRFQHSFYIENTVFAFSIA
jgi:hypothetical protein